MLKLHANMHAYRPDRALDWLRPAMQKCDELGVVVLLHTGDGPYSIPTQFYPIIREFPNVNFIIGHFGVQTGGVYCFEAFWMIMDSPNVYGESGWLLQSRIVEFAKEMPRDRLVFGTDSPPNDPGMWLTHLEVLCHEPPQGLAIGEDQLEDYMGNKHRPAGRRPAHRPARHGGGGQGAAGRGKLRTPHRLTISACGLRADLYVTGEGIDPMTAAGFTESQDLHDFVDAYAQAHPEDVWDIARPVPDSQDAAALVWELAAAGRHEMLRFRDIAGAPFEVLTNVFACRRRVARILGAAPDDLHAVFQARASRLIEPVETEGPALDHAVEGDAVDLTSFPLLTHFATDRAPYITSGIMVVEGKDGAAGNLSYHRSMVHSPAELATSLHSRGDIWRMLGAAAERGDTLPAALVLGGHPLFMLAASARAPMTVDERWAAGGLFGRPLEVVRTPGYGIRVPASADFVFEGVIDPRARVEEGPFGEFTGYSSDRSTNSLFRVEVMASRTDPMLLDMAGGNSADHLNLARIPRESENGRKDEEPVPGGVGPPLPELRLSFPLLREAAPGPARPGPPGHAGPSGLGSLREDGGGGGRGHRRDRRFRGAVGAGRPLPAGRGSVRGGRPPRQPARPVCIRGGNHFAAGVGCDAWAGIQRG